MTLHVVAISDLEILHLMYVYALAVYFKLDYSTIIGRVLYI